MKKIFIILCVSFFSICLSAQGIGIHKNLLEYNLASTYVAEFKTLSNVHSIRLSRVKDRTRSVGAVVDYYKYKGSYGSYFVNSIGAGVLISKFNASKGAIAPFGKYRNHVFIVRNVKLTPDMESEASQENNSLLLNYRYEFGNKTSIANGLILDFGFHINASIPLTKDNSGTLFNNQWDFDIIYQLIGFRLGLGFTHI